jgi:hypothetical protein
MKRHAIGVVITACVAALVHVASPAPASAAPPGAPRVTMIGDSTMAATRWYGRNGDINAVIGNSYDLLYDAESCRRLVATSCVGRIDPVTGVRSIPTSLLPLIQGPLRGQLGQVLVIMTGYDDTTILSAIEAIMAEAQAQGVNRVFWLNYRTSTTYGYGPYYAAHNQRLAEAGARWPSLEVLDWDGYTRSLPQATQDDWFTPDDIHMTRNGAFGLNNYIKANLDSRPIARCLVGNAQTGTPTAVGTPAPSEAAPSGFVGVTPVRLLDTREPTRGGAAGMVGAGRSVAVSFGTSLPSGATSAVLSVTATRPCRNGYLTVYDCTTLALVSSLNYATLRTTTNTVVARPTNGQVCVYSSAATEVVVDLVGAFVPGANRFTPTAPTKWADTRGGGVVSLPAAPMSNGAQYDIPVAGSNGVPANATAVAVTASVTSTGLGGYLTLYPGPCATAPLSAAVAAHATRTSSADTFVALGSNGGLCAHVGGGSPQHISVVTKGWFAPGSGLSFVATTPNRLLDTRNGNGPPVAAGAQATVGATTIQVLNIAGVRPAAAGTFSAVGCGVAAAGPQANVYPNEVVAAISVAAPNASGQICVPTSATEHIVVDSMGRFVAAP